MARELAVPAADDKAGKKIDYLAARVGQALAAEGFKRSGRNVVAERGSGADRHWAIVNFQSGSGNSGPRGDFHVNVALQFPSVIEVLARLPGREWRLDTLAKPEESSAQLRERLDRLRHRSGAPAVNDRVTEDTDLPALADTLVAALRESALPWLALHGTLAAVRDYTESLLVADVDPRIAAALALGDIAGAGQLLAAQSSRWAQWGTKQLADTRTWLQGYGVDVSALPTAPPPRAPSRWEQQQEEQARAAAAAERALVQELQDSREGQAPGVALLALLDRLIERERKAKRHPLRPDVEEFEFDVTVGAQVKALLPQLPAPDLATCEAVFERFDSLVTRFEQDLVTGRHPWPFVALVGWLDKAAAPHRQALKPAVQRWLDAFAERVVARYVETGRALAEEDAKPLDPSHPMHDLLLEGRQQRAALRKDDAEVQRRLRDYPEQALVREDKDAVATLRRWLRRDALTDRVPFGFDADDWGAASQGAWDALPADLCAALRPAMEWLAETATTRPAQRWQKSLAQHVAAVPPAHAEAWRAWWMARLLAFEASDGRIEWATTGARPGVGARLGDTSEALLVGGLWWCWADAGIASAPLAEALQRVAAAAWRHIPDVGARAASVGTLALQMLAGTGAEGRAAVQALAAEHRTRKQLQKAAEQALASPLARQNG